MINLELIAYPIPNN